MYTWDNTNPPLDGFDCVIHLNGATPYNGFPTAGQAAMMDFSDGAVLRHLRLDGLRAQNGVAPDEHVAFIDYQGGSASARRRIPS